MRHNFNQKTAQLSASQDSSVKQPPPSKPNPKLQHQIKQQYLHEKISSQHNLTQTNQQLKSKSSSLHNFKKDKKNFCFNINEQIFQTISSADKIIRLVLDYNHIQLEKDFSRYLLNKQKLLYYLETNQFLHPKKSNNLIKTQKITKSKHYNPRENDSSQTEEIPINHLQRLERIVYSKIIPLLQTDYQYSKNKKLGKRQRNDYHHGSNELQDGLRLLERMQGKETIAIDQCSEILERFINKTVQREENMMKKIQKLQAKLDIQMCKRSYKERLEKKVSHDGKRSSQQSGKSKKRHTIYEEFAKSIKQSFLSHNKISQKPQTQQTYKQLLTQINTLLTLPLNQKSDKKKCQHKMIKQSIHQQQINLFQSQIKNLKQIIKNLDNQLLLIKQQCQSIQQKYTYQHDNLHKLQHKQRKLTQQLQTINKKNDQYIQENKYKNILIQNYIQLINKLQEDLKIKQQQIHNLKYQHLQLNQILCKNGQEKQQYLQHIIKIEERIKQDENILECKAKQIQELEDEMGCKLKELNELERKIQLLMNENRELRQDLMIKNNIIDEYKMVKIHKQLILQQKDSWRDKSSPTKHHAFVAEQLIISAFSDRDNNKQLQIHNQSHDKQVTTQILAQQLQKIEQQAEIIQIQQELVELEQSNHAKMIIQPNDYDLNQFKKKQQRQDYVPGAIDYQEIQNIKKFYLIVQTPKKTPKKIIWIQQDHNDHHIRQQDLNQKQEVIDQQPHLDNIQQQGHIIDQNIMAHKIIQRNDGEDNGNKKRHERQDYVPGAIDYQEIQQLRRIYQMKLKQQQKLYNNEKQQIKIQSEQQGHHNHIHNKDVQQKKNVNIEQQKQIQQKFNGSLQNQPGKTLKDDIIQLQNINAHQQFKYNQNLQNSQQKSLPYPSQNQQKSIQQYLQNTKSKQSNNQHSKSLNPLILQQHSQQQADDNIQQLFKTYRIINQKMASIQEHIKHCQAYPQDVRICKEDLYVIFQFLNANKQKLVKQYKIIKLSEELRRKADNQVLRLKHCFNDAFLKDINESSIMRAYRDEDKSPQEDLNLNIFLQPVQNNDDDHIFKQIQNNIKRLSSRDIQQQQSNSSPQQFSIQKISNHSHPFSQPLNDGSPGHKYSAQNLNKSLLDLVQNFNNNKPASQHQIIALDFQQIIIQEETLKDKKSRLILQDKAVQTYQRSHGQNQLDYIGNMINYHKQQLLNLHKLLRQQTTTFKQHQNNLQIYTQKPFLTPMNTPLINKTLFIDNILKAPSKQKQHDSDRSSHIQTFSPIKTQHPDLITITLQKQFQIQQLTHIMNQRQFEYSQVIKQKQNEIQRLKSIINTLTNIQITKQDRPRSIHSSRNRQELDLQKQRLKRQNEELKSQEEQFKMEIERLNIKIKHSQLNEEIMKIKISAKSSMKPQADGVETDNREKNQEILSQMRSIQSKSGILSSKIEQDKRISEIRQQQNLQDNNAVSKRNKIVRKSKATKHKPPLFTIEDLVPEYYGKKHK